MSANLAPEGYSIPSSPLSSASTPFNRLVSSLVFASGGLAGRELTAATAACPSFSGSISDRETSSLWTMALSSRLIAGISVTSDGLFFLKNILEMSNERATFGPGVREDVAQYREPEPRENGIEKESKQMFFFSSNLSKGRTGECTMNVRVALTG